jgi:hypothetical protein
MMMMGKYILWDVKPCTSVELYRQFCRSVLLFRVEKLAQRANRQVANFAVLLLVSLLGILLDPEDG